jgi:hypothetical protein
MMNWRSVGGFSGSVGDGGCFSRWKSAHEERSEETRVSHEVESRVFETAAFTHKIALSLVDNITKRQEYPSRSQLIIGNSPG